MHTSRGHVGAGRVDVVGLDGVLSHAQLVTRGVGLRLDVHHRAGQQGQTDQDDREHAEGEQHPGPSAAPTPGSTLLACHRAPSSGLHP
jgi:hypothetical protein